MMFAKMNGKLEIAYYKEFSITRREIILDPLFC
jgi:hypothetical protein